MSGQTVALMLIAKAAESVMAGMAANAAGKANQVIAQQNAIRMRQQANNARLKAIFDANLQRKKGTAALARGKVGFLKGGVALAGSPVEVLGEAAADFEFQAKTTQYGGELDATTFEDQARMTEYGGRVAAWRGKTQQRQAFIGGGISLIGAGFSSGVIPTPSNPFASLGTSGPFSPGSFPARTTNLPSYTVNQSPFASGSYTANPNIFR